MQNVPMLSTSFGKTISIPAAPRKGSQFRQPPWSASGRALSRGSTTNDGQRATKMEGSGSVLTRLRSRLSALRKTRFEAEDMVVAMSRAACVQLAARTSARYSLHSESLHLKGNQPPREVSEMITAPDFAKRSCFTSQPNTPRRHQR
jgi:hypothetical protein